MFFRYKIKKKSNGLFVKFLLHSAEKREKNKNFSQLCDCCTFLCNFWLFWGIGERRFSKRTGFDDLQAKVQNRNTSLSASLKK